MKNTKIKDDVQLESKTKRKHKSVDSMQSPKNDAKLHCGDEMLVNQHPIKIKEKQGVEENIARKVFAYEEELSITQESLLDLEEFRGTCSSIESVVTEINNLKEEKGEDEPEMQLKKTNAMMLTTNLKKLNRIAQIRGKKAKEGTLEVKSKVDGMHLELQNLLYEVMHMKKEIEKCMNFSSKDEEIDLVPIEKFYQDAPAELSKPDETKTDEHKQMLARLAWELKHRKELAAKKNEFVEQKKKIEVEISEKSDYLVNLKPRLDQIIKATLPVQEFMGMPLEAERLIFEKAQFLPRPLYVLYIQAKAFKDVCDKGMTVTIDGDILEAKADFHSEDQPDFSDDSDTEQNDGVEENNRGRKSKKEEAESRLEVQRKRLFTKHSLTVVIKICKEGHYTLCLEFSHLTALRISTVDVKLELNEDLQTYSLNSLLEPNLLLKDLLSKDDGKVSPNPSNGYQLNKLGMSDFLSYLKGEGIPYYWVQWICGMNYSPDEEIQSHVPDSTLSVKHFQSVIKTIKSRLDARISLLKQLQLLEQLAIPPPSKKSLAELPTKIVSMLTNWKLLPIEECENIASFKELLDQGMVTEECSTYCATLTREESLTSLIIIHENYPLHPPIILLSMDDGIPEVNKASKLFCLEREVNAYTEELMLQEDKNMLLSNMIRKLQMCFDMYVETGEQHTAKEKLYKRRNRGRDRNRPYRYHKDGYFIHR